MRKVQYYGDEIGFPTEGSIRLVNVNRLPQARMFNERKYSILLSFDIFWVKIYQRYLN